MSTVAEAPAKTKIILLSKPGCVQCGAVERRLEEHGADIEKVDLSKDSDWFDRVVREGVTSVPITMKPGAEFEEWVLGFDRDAIDRLF